MNVRFTIFTPFEDYHQGLEYAAKLWGIEAEYWDIWGNRHVTSPEVRRSILESMGVAAGTLEDLNHSIADRLWREWTSLTPPVLVVSGNARRPALAVRIPEALEMQPARIEIAWEDGSHGGVDRSLAELDVSASARLRNDGFVEKHIELPASPLGEHHLRVVVKNPDGPPLSSETTLIVTPDRAYQPPELAQGGKRAGLYVSLYGIHSERSWGCGDFSDLQRLSAWVANRAGGSFIALNPLHAIHNRQPFNTSPYLPNCIFYQNPIYLDIERIEDYLTSRWCLALRNSSSIRAEIEVLRQSDFVEYERVYRIKRAFLQLAFRKFMREYNADTRRARDFRNFVEREGLLLERYAVYCALDEWIHRKHPKVWTWPEWPNEYQDPGSSATKEFALSHWRRVLFHKYVQWQIDRQLTEAQSSAREAGLSIGLLHDLALATDSCGSDLWAQREFFVAGCRVGSPPDDFSPKGQDWAFPPPAVGPALAGWLPSIPRNNSEKLPARWSASDRPRDALLPAVLDSGRQRGLGRNLCPGPVRGSDPDPRARRAFETK